jgi:heme/copper-type cytochrome/quinol oxidase subunit 1
MENTMIGAAGRAHLAGPAARAQQRTVSRWLIPVGGGLLSAALIVVGTPHVAWYLRLPLALIAFAYIGGQSAAYLWSSHSDQG